MSNFLQVAGVVAITVGVCLVSIPLGIIVGGVLITVAGYALGR